MFAVVNHLQFTKPVDELKELVQNEAIPVLSKNEGFINFYLVKEDEFKAIVLIIWKDGGCAQAGAKSFGPSWFVPNLKPLLVGGEGRSTGEIIAFYK
jgi:heme-degrading monooxygenase HmoA